MEDANGVTQAANQNISALLDDTPSEEMLCLVLSFEVDWLLDILLSSFLLINF